MLEHLHVKNLVVVLLFVSQVSLGQNQNQAHVEISKSKKLIPEE